MHKPDYIDTEGAAHYLSDGKTDPVIVCSWRVRDPRRKSGWRELHWKMTPTDAQAWAEKNAAELAPVPGTEEARFPLEGWGCPDSGHGLHK